MTSRERRVLSRFLFVAMEVIKSEDIPCTRYHLALGYVAYRLESVARVLSIPDGNLTLGVSSAITELENDVRKLRQKGTQDA